MENNMNAQSSSPTALITDGSALYFGQRAVSPDRNMDYAYLLDVLKQPKTNPRIFRPALYFTASDQTNEKQAKFHQHLEDLGLKVVEVPPYDATVNNPLLSEQTAARVTRFDALIGYSLGRLSATTQGLEIFVITDSFPVALPVREAVERGASVTVAFFGSCIDTRWHKLFREAEASKKALHFLDLEMFTQRLFQRARPGLARKEGTMLPDLP